MSRAQPAAVAPAPVPTDVFKSKRRDSIREASDDIESPRGRKYSLARTPSSRSGSSYSRHDSPDGRHRRRRPRRRSYGSSYSRSRSPPYRRSRDAGGLDDHDKPWFKKKSVWATIASLASVASVAAVSMSTQATRQSAHATRKSAHAVQKSAAATIKSAEATQSSAKATRESANASNRIANETVRSTQAVVNTAVANGHQDHAGRYHGPPPRQGRSRRRAGSSSTYAGRGHNLLEYHPIPAKVG